MATWHDETHDSQVSWELCTCHMINVYIVFYCVMYWALDLLCSCYIFSWRYIRQCSIPVEILIENDYGLYCIHHYQIKLNYDWIGQQVPIGCTCHLGHFTTMTRESLNIRVKKRKPIYLNRANGLAYMYLKHALISATNSLYHHALFINGGKVSSAKQILYGYHKNNFDIIMWMAPTWNFQIKQIQYDFEKCIK